MPLNFINERIFTTQSIYSWNLTLSNLLISFSKGSLKGQLSNKN